MRALARCASAAQLRGALAVPALTALRCLYMWLWMPATAGTVFATFECVNGYGRAAGLVLYVWAVPAGVWLGFLLLAAALAADAIPTRLERARIGGALQLAGVCALGAHVSLERYLQWNAGVTEETLARAAAAPRAADGLSRVCRECDECRLLFFGGAALVVAALVVVGRRVVRAERAGHLS